MVIIYISLGICEIIQKQNVPSELPGIFTFALLAVSIPKDTSAVSSRCNFQPYIALGICQYKGKFSSVFMS